MCDFGIAAAVVSATGAVVSGVNQKNAADAQAGYAAQNADIAARNGERAADSILTVSGYNAAVDDNNALTVEYNARAQAEAVRAATAYQEEQLRTQAGLIDQNTREAGAAARRAAAWDAAVLNSDAAAGEALAGERLRLAQFEAGRQLGQVARVVGSARAALGKSGVSLEGSALDMLAETAADGELEALMTRYKASLDANEGLRQAGLKRASSARTVYEGTIEANNIEYEGQVRAGMLRREADMTAWQGGVEVAQLNHTAQVQAAQLRTQASWTRWQGEVDAGNARAGAATQAWQYRSQAEMLKAEGSNALVGGVFKAGTSLLSAAGDYTTRKSGGYGNAKREDSTGRMIGGL